MRYVRVTTLRLQIMTFEFMRPLVQFAVVATADIRRRGRVIDRLAALIAGTQPRAVDTGGGCYRVYDVAIQVISGLWVVLLTLTPDAT